MCSIQIISSQSLKQRISCLKWGRTMFLRIFLTCSWNFFSYWVVLSSINFTLSCCILFCPVLLSFLGGLLFSEEKMDLKRIWGRWDVQYELGGVEGANCGWYVWYERRIYLQKERMKQLHKAKECCSKEWPMNYPPRFFEGKVIRLTESYIFKDARKKKH